MLDSYKTRESTSLWLLCAASSEFSKTLNFETNFLHTPFVFFLWFCRNSKHAQKVNELLSCVWIILKRRVKQVQSHACTASLRDFRCSWLVQRYTNFFFWCISKLEKTDTQKNKHTKILMKNALKKMH
jgi:hypothetical protein